MFETGLFDWHERFKKIDKNGDPYSKTIWLFREQLTGAGLTEELFDRFDQCLNESGFKAKMVKVIMDTKTI